MVEGGRNAKRKALMVLAATGVVLTATVLLVTGVVLHHKARHSVLLSQQGAIYPVGMRPEDTAPRHAAHTYFRQRTQTLPPATQSLRTQTLPPGGRPDGMLPHPAQSLEAAPTDDVAGRMSQYAMLHPVYNRCAKQADLTAFNAAITKSCGNIHELGSCSYTCSSVMAQWSAKMGCCFESVLAGYKYASPAVEHSWRLWQGTLSGKCGVTFETESCGESMGEHGLNVLQKSVDSAKNAAAWNQWDISNLADKMYTNQKNTDYHPQDSYYYDPYDWNDSYYGANQDWRYNYDNDEDEDAYDKYYGAADFFNDDYDFTTDRHFSGDDYKYPDGSLVPPSHFKQLQQREHKQAMPLVRDDVTYQYHQRALPADLGSVLPPSPAEEAAVEPKQRLGDEVMDMPPWQNEDTGDVHLPSEHVKPYMYSHGEHIHPPRWAGSEAPGDRETEGAQQRWEEARDASSTQSLAQTGAQQQQQQMHVYKGQQLAGEAYDASINYMNTLRIKEALRGERPLKYDAMVPHFGESWQGRAQGDMSDDIAAIAPPTPGDSWQGKDNKLQSLKLMPRGLMPSQLPFEARSASDKATAEADPSLEAERQAEEDGVAFPLARGILIGGAGEEGVGRPAAAAVDSIASPLEGPLFSENPANRGHNRLTRAASIREARYENNWDNARIEEEKHPFARLNSFQESAPPSDKNSRRLSKLGVNV